MGLLTEAGDPNIWGTGAYLGIDTLAFRGHLATDVEAFSAIDDLSTEDWTTGEVTSRRRLCTLPSGRR